MSKLSIRALVENLGIVNDFLAEPLKRENCSKQVFRQIRLAVEEIFVNIASYAYSPSTGIVVVEWSMEDDTKTIVLTFTDKGVPYDPLGVKDPDTDSLDPPVGGLGIFLVKRSVDDISYEYRDGMNILTLKKRLQSQEAKAG